MDDFSTAARPPAASDIPGEGSEILAALTNSVIYERTLTGDVTSVTDSVQSVFGFDPAAVNAGGLAWWLARVHDDDRQLAASRLSPERCRMGDAWSLEYRIRRADGRWTLVKDCGRCLPAKDGQPARIVGVLTDISDVRALRDDAQRTQRLEIIARVVAGVAHDFNNVLGAIGSFTSVLLDALDRDDPRAEDLRQIETLVARGAALSQNLLGLARPGSGGARRLLDVSEEIRRIAPTIRILMGSAVDCTFALPSLDHTAYLEPSALDQVLLNLAANARDAMPNGGSFHVATDVDVRLSPARLRLVLRDSGHGMPPQVLASCFTPFFTTKGERRGTGLGLWLVREIVEGAGGRIHITSAPTHGTTVTIEFLAMDEAPSREPIPLPRATPMATGFTALFIEDEEIVRSVTKRLLERSGFHVLDMPNGMEGLAVLADRGPDIDVVITDLHMPGLAGPALVRRLREVAPELGIIVMSGLAERYVDLVPTPGQLEFLPKPTDPAQLTRSAIAMAVATRERRHRAVAADVGHPRSA